MKILIIDKNHPILQEKLINHGFDITEKYTDTKEQVEEYIADFDGLIIRSRFPLDNSFLEKAKKLKFIGRVGAGLENIDLEAAKKLGVHVFNAPEGNRDAVAEHALGMLISLMNHFQRAGKEIAKGLWKREENRGEEVQGKTVGLIGYGNMGKAFAKRLSGFGCKVVFHDILLGLEDDFAKQVSLKELQKTADIVSLHTPLTESTINMVNSDFINSFEKSFYFINTARGNSVIIKDLVSALESGKIKAAGLDVLEYEKSSFESLDAKSFPKEMQYLLDAENVILTPHIAGWTHESKIKLAEVIADKIISYKESV